MAGCADDEESRRRLSWTLETCVVLEMPKPEWGGHRPVPGLGSASRPHLSAGLAGLAAAGIAGLATTGTAGLAGLDTARADADAMVRTTIRPGLAGAGFATPITLSLIH